MDEGEERPSKKRRVTQSCNNCRKKRIKCDGQTPVCSPCAAKDASCSWSVAKKRGPVPGKNAQAKLQRISNHLYDLYQAVPGLEAISEMLLGLQTYDAQAVPSLLQPRLPATLGDWPAYNMSANSKHAAWKSTAAGKHLDDDGEYGNDPSPTADDAPQAAFSIGSDPGTSRTQLSELPEAVPQPPSALQLLCNSSSDDLTQVKADSYQDNLVYEDSLEAFLKASQYDMLESPLPHRITWEKGFNDRNLRLYGATSGFIELGAVPKIPSNPSPPISPTDLPQPISIPKLFETYLHIIHPYMPMCPRLDLMQWSCNPRLSSDPNVPWALVFAIFACAMPYSGQADPVAASQEASAMRKKARYRIIEDLHNPTVSTVQALLLLSLADWGEGELTLAWLGISQAISLAIHLGLHIPPSSGQYEVDQTQRLLTWYSLAVLDTAFASQLGRWPLLPGITADLDLPTTGYDEWDFWKSQNPDDLNRMYSSTSGGPLAPSTQPQPAVPSRIYTTFGHSVALAKIAQKILTIANAVERTRSQMQALKGCWDDLESLGRDLEVASFEDEQNISSHPQHRIDVHLLWYHWRLVVMRELISTGDMHADASHGEVVKARNLVAVKSRLHTYYRASIGTSLLAFTVASMARSSASANHPEIVALRQLECIFPKMAQKLLSTLPLESVNAPARGSYRFNFPHAHLPVSDVAVQSATPHKPLPQATPTSLHPDATRLTSAPQNVWHFAQYSQPVANKQDMLVPGLQSTQGGIFASGSQSAAGEDYSLPHQAITSLFETGKLDNQKAFDAASWEQTDVLAALGTIDMPRFSRASTPNELSGLTGMLDRWSHGDGNLWS